MKTDRGRIEVNEKRQRLQCNPRKVAAPREVTVGKLPPHGEPADSCRKGPMMVLGGLQLENRETPGEIHREQIQDSACAGGARKDFGIPETGVERSVDARPDLGRTSAASHRSGGARHSA